MNLAAIRRKENLLVYNSDEDIGQGGLELANDETHSILAFIYIAQMDKDARRFDTPCVLSIA